MSAPTFAGVFELLAKHGITLENAVSKVEAYNDEQVFNLIEKVQECMPACQYPDERHAAPYAFLANDRLSGVAGAWGLKSGYRLSRVSRVAAFAAWYADAVYIHQPLSREKYIHDSKRPLVKPEVAAELEVLLFLRPLLEAGFVRIAANHFPLDARMPVNAIQERIQQITDHAFQKLFAKFGSHVNFSVSRIPSNGFRMTIAKGPLELIDNRSTDGHTGVIGHFTFGEEIRGIPSRRKASW
jgi:hypothetical protein